MQHRLIGFVCGCVSMFQFGLTSAQGALAPQYERQRELAAIIGDTGVVDKVGVIEKIEVIAPRRFRVWSAKCVIEVSLELDRTQARVIGSAPLHVVSSAPQCK